MGTRSQVMFALARGQDEVQKALDGDDTPMCQLRPLKRQLEVFTFSLMQMRNSTVILDADLEGLCTEMHQEKLAKAGIKSVQSLLHLKSDELKEILSEDFELAVGLFAALLSDSNNKRRSK